MDYTSQAVPKFRAAAQQLSAYSCATPEEEVTDTDVFKKQLNEIQAQVAVMQTATPRKAKVNCPDPTEIGTLKRQIADIQAQLAGMREAIHEAKNDHLEATEIKALKQQLAFHQAQVSPPQAQSHQIPSPAFSRDFSMTARHQSPNKRVSGQSSSGLTKTVGPVHGTVSAAVETLTWQATVRVNLIPFSSRKRDSCVERNNSNGIRKMAALASSS